MERTSIFILLGLPAGLATASLSKIVLPQTLVKFRERVKQILSVSKNVCLHEVDMDSYFLCLQRSHVKSLRRLQPSPQYFLHQFQVLTFIFKTFCETIQEYLRKASFFAC